MQEPRGSDPLVVNPSECGLYLPGHQSHWIQAKLARETESDPAKYRVGRFVAVDDDGWIAVDVQAEVLRFWNHNPLRTRSYFGEPGERVGLLDYGILHARFDLRNGYLIYICATESGPTPCRLPYQPQHG